MCVCVFFFGKKSTYMNFLLPAHSSSNTRPFTSSHFVVTPLSVSKIKSSLMLYQSQLQPPHFDVIFEHNGDKYLIPLNKGANNVFDALCVFLYLVKRDQVSNCFFLCFCSILFWIWMKLLFFKEQTTKATQTKKRHNITIFSLIFAPCFRAFVFEQFRFNTIPQNGYIDYTSLADANVRLMDIVQ